MKMLAGDAPSVPSGHLPRCAGEEMPAATLDPPPFTGEVARRDGGGVDVEGQVRP
jgi:hypothetical protein